MSAIPFPLPRYTQNTWTSTRPSNLYRSHDLCLVERSPKPKLPVSLFRLFSLLDENGEDDHGKVGPSQFAFKTAFMMIAEALPIVGKDIPSSPSVDSQGGIRITWRNGDKTVKLVCPAAKDGTLYIYQSSSSGNSLRNQNVNTAVLAERLSWLSASEPAAAASADY